MVLADCSGEQFLHGHLLSGWQWRVCRPGSGTGSGVHYSAEFCLLAVVIHYSAEFCLGQLGFTTAVHLETTCVCL